jgi:hypothetical protein
MRIGPGLLTHGDVWWASPAQEPLTRIAFGDDPPTVRRGTAMLPA